MVRNGLPTRRKRELFVRTRWVRSESADDSKRQTLLKLTMTSVQDEIGKRIQAGEFGNPPNIDAVVKATEELTKKSRNTFVSITGLWANDKSAKVAYEGRTSEDLTIPSGSKVIAFNRDKTGDNQPDLNLVFVEYED